ncbi:MAG: hypothetical protein ACPH53_00920, partial [Flavobacteriaceae bacterium]
MSQLAYIKFDQYTTLSGEQMDFRLSYKLFGLPLGSAPVVLVNHSLTGYFDASIDMKIAKYGLEALHVDA